MIDGLKLAMSGAEVIALINRRIDRIRAIVAIKRDAIDGKGPPPRRSSYTQVPAEVVEREVRAHEHRIAVLTMIREHMLAGETYLLSECDLHFGELLPEGPPPLEEEDVDPNAEIRWVTHPVDVSGALQPAGSSGE